MTIIATPVVTFAFADNEVTLFGNVIQRGADGVWRAFSCEYARGYAASAIPVRKPNLINLVGASLRRLSSTDRGRVVTVALSPSLAHAAIVWGDLPGADAIVDEHTVSFGCVKLGERTLNVLVTQRSVGCCTFYDQTGMRIGPLRI